MTTAEVLNQKPIEVLASTQLKNAEASVNRSVRGREILRDKAR